MAKTDVPISPYITGTVLGSRYSLFGREETLQWVETQLSSCKPCVVVLYGQRRIGKTSILHHLEKRLSEEAFLPVYMDLMQHAQRELRAVLYDLATSIVYRAELDINAEFDDFDAEGCYFSEKFLPHVHQLLASTSRHLVFLFDEFDTLDDIEPAEGLSTSMASQSLLNYLGKLVEIDKELSLVTVVGREMKDLTTGFQSAFPNVYPYKVSVLPEADVEDLIRLAENQGYLQYTDAAIARVYNLTSGHPFLVQLICDDLFRNARSKSRSDVPRIDVRDVDLVVPKIVSKAEHVFEDIWENLSYAEQAVFAACSQLASTNTVVDESMIVDVLQQQSVRIKQRDLQDALGKLTDWDVFCQEDQGYRFYVDLMKQWARKRKTLALVRDKLKPDVPLSKTAYLISLNLFRRGNFEQSIEYLRTQVLPRSNYLPARLLLGECLRELGHLQLAVEEFESAYEQSPQMARLYLVQALRQQGDSYENESNPRGALDAYVRILEISPEEADIREKYQVLQDHLESTETQGQSQATQRPLSPYIVGSALDSEGFFGREDLLRFVETELSSEQQNAVVLFGQRRIGKTSILLQLHRRLPERGFVPIYVDLMDRARMSLGRLLAELAEEVAFELDLDSPEESQFDDQGKYFHQVFLPSVYATLDNSIEGSEQESRDLVFLFDEFDVLDLAAVEELPQSAAARTLFPYLRQLMRQEKRLGFVIVIGRRMEELSVDFQATFRAARYLKVSVLSAKDARRLIRLPEQANTLRYTDAAVDRIIALTSGHAYLTQLTCFLLFERAWERNVASVPIVDSPDVDAIIPDVLEAGHNALEWIWAGLPSAERVIFSTIAQGTTETSTLTQDQIVEVLQRHGIRILIRELELAPLTLVSWEMLQRVDSDDGNPVGYRFFIELVRRWVSQNKPLSRVRDELDRVDPLADQFYQIANTFYRQANLEEAIVQLRQALSINPNHLRARLLLGTGLREKGDVDAAVEEFARAYEYDEQSARYELVRTLLVQAEGLEKRDDWVGALQVYERILQIAPNERLAKEKQGQIRQLVAAREQKATIKNYIELGQKATAEQDWSQAIDAYSWLAANDPDETQWVNELESAKAQQVLDMRYSEAMSALKNGESALAIRALVEVIGLQPDYRESTRYLHLAVSGTDVESVQAGIEDDGTKPQERQSEFRTGRLWRLVALVELAIIAGLSLAMVLLLVIYWSGK